MRALFSFMLNMLHLGIAAHFPLTRVSRRVECLPAYSGDRQTAASLASRPLLSPARAPAARAAIWEKAVHAEIDTLIRQRGDGDYAKREDASKAHSRPLASRPSRAQGPAETNEEPEVVRGRVFDQRDRGPAGAGPRSGARRCGHRIQMSRQQRSRVIDVSATPDDKIFDGKAAYDDIHRFLDGQHATAEFTPRTSPS